MITHSYSRSNPLSSLPLSWKVRGIVPFNMQEESTSDALLQVYPLLAPLLPVQTCRKTKIKTKSR